MIRSTTLDLHPHVGLGWLRTCWGLAVRLRAGRQAAREMRWLSDEMLRDIGLSRADIESCARYGRQPAGRARGGLALPARR